MIELTRAQFGATEERHIAAALASGAIGSGGPYTERAERFLSSLHHERRVLLTSSGTHALELGARLLDLGPGDEVIVPSFTFVTTASAFALAGVKPVFVDIRRDTLNIDPVAAAAAITPRTRAICAMHYGGVGAEPDRFAELAASHGLFLVEDNAHGLTGRYKGEPLGTFGAWSILSFDSAKNVSCGEGGALVVNDDSLAERAQILLDKGTNRAAFRRGDVSQYTWVDLGSNWGLAEPLAAMLVAQFERIDDIQRARHACWQRYETELSTWADAYSVALPEVPADCEHTAHLFSMVLPTKSSRDALVAHLATRGVQAAFHYQALHLSAVGQRFGGTRGQCPVAEDVADTLVRIPIHNSLTEEEQTRVIDSLVSFDFTP